MASTAPKTSKPIITTIPSPASSKLFEPLALGNLSLSHRVVLAPLTRLRANKAHVHGDLAVEYYSQRARSISGTLLITEATYIAAKGGGSDHVPGVWNDEQVKAWKRVADAVHRDGSYIFMQIWALGRAATPKVLAAEDPSFPYVSSSDVPLSSRPSTDPAPRPLTIPEIQEYVKLFGEAAHNAVHGAGFDGVEIHGAHGYLVDQFLQDVCNKREDEYGGSVESRSRFALEVVDEIVKRVGAEKVGIRISPWSRFQDMRMEDPIPTFTYLVTQIATRHPTFAYIHVPEPRVSGSADRVPTEGESNDFLRSIWASGSGAEKRVYISAGGHTVQTAVDAVEKAAEKGEREAVAFGRAYISNPDLPLRIKHNIPWTPYVRPTFYTYESPVGYIDYPFATIDAGVEAEKHTPEKHPVQGNALANGHLTNGVRNNL